MAYSANKSGNASSDNEKWYYMVGEQKCGPVDTSDLISKLASGELAPDTRVWSKSLGKWTPANDTDLINQANAQEESSAEDNQKAEKPGKKPRWLIWAIIGVLVAAILAVAVFFLFFRNKKEDTVIPETTEAVEILTYGLAEPVVYEDENCKFLVDNISENGDFLELDVRCVNKTSDVLQFSWRNTSINGFMFDPYWSVRVSSNSAMESSITFPCSVLNSWNVLRADEINFVLSVFNDSGYRTLLEDSAQYIVPDFTKTGEVTPAGYQRFEGFGKYLFTKKVKSDDDGRPYYLKDEKPVYFDEIRDANGDLVYTMDFVGANDNIFYRDHVGRPYYFSLCGHTICHSCESTVSHDCTANMCSECGSVIYYECGAATYYDGYGFAFSDAETGKNYFYDINGKPAYYGNDGIPEYYEGTPTQEMLDAGMPEELTRANGCFLVHKEFSLYPTGLQADEVTYPERVKDTNEQVFWDGDKGCFVVLNGKQNVTGYSIQTYVENRSDHYIYMNWEDVEVNGIAVFPHAPEALRPHSYVYTTVTVPTKTLTDYKVGTVQQVEFRVQVKGENLSVPLYPIKWMAPVTAKTTEPQETK